MRYRKKPVVIEAFRYLGPISSTDGEFYIHHNIPHWAKKAIERKDMFYSAVGELYINTLEGVHHVSVGDYVIQGIKGELYPCKQDIFEQTYEPVEDEA